MKSLIINKKFIVSFNCSLVDIYENNTEYFKDKLLHFESDISINDISFNPILDNIILISFFNGSCKIYDILEKELKEKIVLEESKEIILQSKFNILNTNIIGSLCYFKIIVWDVRNIKYIKIIENKEKILKFRWNSFSENLLEITTEKEVKLIDIKTNKTIKVVKNEMAEDDIIFVKKDIIIIKLNSIEKLNDDNNIFNSLEFEEIKEYNDNFIRDDILIIFFNISTNINFIDINKMELILNVNYGTIKIYAFINSDKENEIILYYLKAKKNKINVQNIQLNNKILKNTIMPNKTNLGNDFYEKYQKKIYRYINLLKFEENIVEEDKENKGDKCVLFKYMDIEEIKKYFNEIKKIDIFSRKDFINNIFEEKNNEIQFSDILNINNFLIIKELNKIFKIEDTEKIKKELMVSINNNINKNKENIISLYIKIIKLLILDNTNKKLIEIYLIFLNEYETHLLEHFSEEKIERYKKEVKYYYPCFSQKEYKILFGLDKNSEENIITKFLEEAYNLEKFNYNNEDLKNLVNKANKLLLDMPDFNQPIELDCSNEELKWHKIKINILSTFQDLKLISDEQYKLGRLKAGIQNTINKKILTNKNIFTNKDKLECALLFITNPCNVFSKDLEICSNLLLSEKEELTEKDLNDFIKNNKNTSFLKLIKNSNNKYCLEYNNTFFNTPEYLCLNNLFIKDLEQEEKYNFNYLINNYVSNQNQIKEFLKKIFKKNVFIEINQLLFGDDNDYKLLNDRYLNEFIDKRLKFAPIRPFECAGVSDKLSLNTYICAKKRVSYITLTECIEELEKILNTGNYILIEENEIFHLLGCIPYYENNCSSSIKTPRKKNYNGETEGGKYLELLLFNKVFTEINLPEALYILNEKNYDKNLTDFKLDFEKLDKKDLKIEGIFSNYNQYIDLNTNSIFDLQNNYIKLKSTSKKSIPNNKISINNDLIPCGNRPNKNNKI